MISKRSKKMNQLGGRNKRKSKRQSKRQNLWAQSFKKARKELNISGFVALKKGTPLYNRTKEIHNKLKSQK